MTRRRRVSSNNIFSSIGNCGSLLPKQSHGDIALRTKMTSFVELVSNIHEINVKIQLLFSYGDFFAISITCFLRYKIHNHMASDHQTQTTSKQNLMERSLV